MAGPTVRDHLWTYMPRHPKPHIKLSINAHFSPWVVIFTNPLYPHTRYTTGQHAHTPQEAWAHVQVMCEWYSCPYPKGVNYVRQFRSVR